MVVYLCSILLLMHLIVQELQSRAKKKWLVVSIVLLSFISGHFWVYPDKIAKGWDSSLAHLPYFLLRQQMDDYLVEHHISPTEVGTQFPYVNAQYTHLAEHGLDFPEYDLDRHTWIIQSNVINDFADEDLDELQQHWKLVKSFERLQVYVRLYAKE